MNCPSCQHDNPSDAHFCANCGVKVVAHTGDHAAIADLVNEPTDAYGITTPLDPVPVDTVSPLDATARYEASAQPSSQHESHVGAPLIAGRKSSLMPIVLAVAVVAAIVIVGAVLVLSGGGDDSVASVTTDDVATSADAAPEEPTQLDTVPATPPPAAPVPATEAPATAVPATDAATTDGAATTASDTLPVTVDATTPAEDPAAVPPIPPEPGPIDAPGSPQVLANVSPSGLPYPDSAASFAIAQELGDALALEDWDLARTLSPELAENSDDDFTRGYGDTNRVSLILVDARPAGSEIELLVVSVAVELGGDQTSLYCLQWNVEPSARTVRQDGGSRIARWQANTQPEAIRNDAEALATVNQCVWP